MKRSALFLLLLLMTMIFSACSRQIFAGSGQSEPISESALPDTSHLSENLSDTSQEESETMLKIQVGENTFTASLADNTNGRCFQRTFGRRTADIANERLRRNGKRS